MPVVRLVRSLRALLSFATAARPVASEDEGSASEQRMSHGVRQRGNPQHASLVLPSSIATLSRRADRQVLEQPGHRPPGRTSGREGDHVDDPIHPRSGGTQQNALEEFAGGGDADATHSLPSGGVSPSAAAHVLWMHLARYLALARAVSSD